ncbi:MAG TPA: BamA/TamA family outer membrane protein [Bacteroidia bacterium]|nr:BamA/TamA family outer membrane protein [Bacteroidia bacterium]HNU34679.1 BamA/TamA family outer membrane protein [Bacteroidia bacterium]
MQQDSPSYKFRVRAKFFAPAAVILFLASCSPYKQLAEGEYLLHRNVLKSDVKLDEGITVNEGLNSIIKQKANRRILGIFRFHLGVYTIGNKGKPTKFKNWLKNTVGEEPVILDTTLTSKSAAQIKLYMKNHGYFNAVVKDTTIYKKKKAIVKYTIKGNEPFYIRNFTREGKDSLVLNIIQNDSANSIVKVGQIYNEDNLVKERERIVTMLRNDGYYFFNQRHINYRVYTKSDTTNVNLVLDIEKMAVYDSIGKNLIGEYNHVQRYVNNVYVNTNYSDFAAKKTFNTETDSVNEFIIFKNPVVHCIKSSVLTDHINFNKGDLYSQKQTDASYRRINTLGLYKFTSINFNTTYYDSINSPLLNAYINLTPLPKQDYKFEFEVTNNGGSRGIAGDVSYRNKNLFCGGENYEIKLRCALEKQKNFVTNDENTASSIFNTYEFGIENNIKIPKSYAFTNWFRKKDASVKTIFTGIYNTQNRPEFNRSIFDFSTALEFSYNRFTKYTITPLQLNFVSVKLDQQFLTNLILLDDPVLLSSYDNHLVTNGKFSFIYNNQELGRQKNFFLFRGNFEIAGNSLRLIKEIQNDTSNLDGFGRYQVLNKPFAQYIRPDADFRFYQVFNQHSSIVYRISGGIGIAYLNSKILPFEKAFFAGGSNDLRAFRARSVGPGAYSAQLNLERIGDIKINTNIEYRFDIFRILEGAFFVDAGNIWLRRKENSQPEAEFNASRFLSQMAIGTGLGFRFDFTFFIFRLDVGVPLKDPSLPEGERWLFKNLQPKDLTYNLGIGYPF